MPSGPALTKEELEQRVAILKRFRELLGEQRKKFGSYLVALDKQKESIESGDVDKLVAQVEFEQGLVAEIHTFQKVINPLEDMYREAYHVEELPPDIPRIKDEIEDMRGEVLKRNEENRALLKQRMGMIRQEIDGLRRPFNKTASVYGSTPAPSMIDIKT